MKINKATNLLFPVLVLGVAAAPLAGMIVAPTETTTENRTLASLPELFGEEGFNVHVLSELGDYFSDHFAGRNELAALDTQIQARLFHVSSVDTIVLGENDWLYYTDSLDDYLGRNVVTERGAYNIAHNIALMQKKVEQTGASFLFTVAPNKNSLYGENMPESMQVKAGDTNNILRVTPVLQQLQVPYADLFEAFRAQDEILYCTQDSHWNGKGAVLAYTEITEAMGREATDYNAVADVVHTKLEAGDLGTALYSIWAEPEWNYRYEYESAVSFTNGAENWEDQWIETTSGTGKDSLLMFRDSFGITLAPFIAEDYAEAGFSRNTVYMLDSYMEQMDPDAVIVEIVERNLDRFGVFTVEDQRSTGPAIMTGPVSDADISGAAPLEEAAAAATIEKAVSAQQPDYLMVTGHIPADALDTETNVYVQVRDGETSTLYEAYTVSCENNDPGTWRDNGYLLYLDSEMLTSDTIEITVLTENSGTFTVVGEGSMSTEVSVDE